MTGASREKDQADFDLERFIELFDEALLSKDERVVNALRSLMMMVILTKPESRNPLSDRNTGPLRRIYEDVHHLNNRLSRVEEEIHRLQRPVPSYESEKENPYVRAQYDPWKGAIGAGLDPSYEGSKLHDILKKINSSTPKNLKEK